MVILVETKMQHKNITPCSNLLNITRNRIGKKECNCNESNIPCIIVHGGAGNLNDSIVIEKMTACKKAATNGYKMLLNGQNSVDAVETALWWLECDEFFNCSYGSVLNELGKVQMDASIMDGVTFKCGSVAAVSDIEHPITLAKYCMNYFPNSIIVGDGAKHLAKHAGMNWISEGNMVAPFARIAFDSAETGKYEIDMDDQYFLNADTLTNSFGTVGCVAYDGYSIAAGTTTGGLNRKLVGRVGDTPILGCGTYATKNAGCSLTGHGESIMKLGLAREIVEDIQNPCSKDVLQKHFTYMLKKFDKTGGGITLQSNGNWTTYFTSEKMPYAAIVNDSITYGTKLHEEIKETYKSSDAEDSECKCRQTVVFIIIASNRDSFSEKLFSFDEWQRYIECRKTILAHAHFPTKMKYGIETVGNNNLYIQFLEHISSKADKTEPDVKNSKHFLPDELISAMTKHITNLNINDSSSKTIEIFPPSVTPLHSYLQHLLDHPYYDVPNIARSDFFLTKVGYTTKPNLITELANQYDIKLEVVDSNLHFLEKYVPPFEPSKMPSIKELQELVDVQDDSKTKRGKESENLNANESLNNYLHAKLPCKMKFDVIKRQYYDANKTTVTNFKDTDSKTDFIFMETLPNGKLAIPTDNNFDDEDDKDNAHIMSNDKDVNMLIKTEFCDKYNLQLSLAEKESIHKLDTTTTANFRKQKLKPARNIKGQFMKGNKRDEYLGLGSSAQSKVKDETHDSDFDDMGILAKVETVFSNVHDPYDENEISASCGNTLAISEKNNTTSGKQRFVRPFSEYWMYHCIFSRVKPKNFAVFERSLPRSFRWLLNECALTVEMSTEDLYEEVCLIETYHTAVLKPCNSENYESSQPISKNQLNLILSRW